MAPALMVAALGRRGAVRVAAAADGDRDAEADHQRRTRRRGDEPARDGQLTSRLTLRQLQGRQARCRGLRRFGVGQHGVLRLHSGWRRGDGCAGGTAARAAYGCAGGVYGCAGGTYGCAGGSTAAPAVHTAAASAQRARAGVRRPVVRPRRPPRARTRRWPRRAAPSRSRSGRRGRAPCRARAPRRSPAAARGSAALRPAAPRGPSRRAARRRTHGCAAISPERHSKRTAASAYWSLRADAAGP